MAPGSQSPSKINAEKTHCPAGHKYDESNTYLHPEGNRKCRACRRVEYLRQAQIALDLERVRRKAREHYDSLVLSDDHGSDVEPQ